MSASTNLRLRQSRAAALEAAEEAFTFRSEKKPPLLAFYSSMDQLPQNVGNACHLQWQLSLVLPLSPLIAWHHQLDPSNIAGLIPEARERPSSVIGNSVLVKAVG